MGPMSTRFIIVNSSRWTLLFDSFLKQEPISKIFTGPSVWSLSFLITT